MIERLSLELDLAKDTLMQKQTDIEKLQVFKKQSEKLSENIT